MLSVLGRGVRLCDGLTRREVLRLGGLAIGGLTLSQLFRYRAIAGETQSRTKSVIMVWLRGGASHIDSFDMKPEAPAEIRGEFRPIATNVPGIQICEHLPLCARLMDKLAILRGIKSIDIGDHTHAFNSNEEISHRGTVAQRKYSVLTSLCLCALYVS